VVQTQHLCGRADDFNGRRAFPDGAEGVQDVVDVGRLGGLSLPGSVIERRGVGGWR
jgi:hypothetical protein